MTLLEDIKKDIKLREPARIEKNEKLKKEREEKKILEEERTIQRHKHIMNELFEHKYKIEFVGLEDIRTLKHGADGICYKDIDSMTIFKIDELQFKLKLTDHYYVLELYNGKFEYYDIIIYPIDNITNKLEEILDTISSFYDRNFPDIKVNEIPKYTSHEKKNWLKRLFD